MEQDVSEGSGCIVYLKMFSCGQAITFIFFFHLLLVRLALCFLFWVSWIQSYRLHDGEGGMVDSRLTAQKTGDRLGIHLRCRGFVQMAAGMKPPSPQSATCTSTFPIGPWANRSNPVFTSSKGTMVSTCGRCPMASNRPTICSHAACAS